VDFRQLANFVQIVDAGSLTRAAAVIGVAQPALTFQIARLEEELGCKLLIRSTRGVHPTDTGSILYREARTVVRQLQQIPQIIRGATTDPAGDVTIGFPNSLAPFFSSNVVAKVQQKFPRIKLHIFEGESLLQREQVMKNRVDIALICEHSPTNDLYHRPLFKLRLAMLCDHQNAAEADEPINLAEAASRIVGLPSAGNPMRVVFDEAIQRLGLVVEARLEFNAMRTLTDAVERGLGASINLWIPQDANERSKIIFRPITNPDLWVNISLCRSKMVQLSPAALLVEQIMADVTLERIGHPDWPGAISQQCAE
jgi:LysR family nitrogen assimilation transcriptional regulator